MEDGSECSIGVCIGGECVPPGTEWCGLTQGFWKENTNKYLSDWSNGRQVCDEFFAGTIPNDVCSVGDSQSFCSCGDVSNCNSWGCIYDIYAKDRPKDQTKIQMMTLYLTQRYEEST